MTKALLGALAISLGAITMSACSGETEAPVEANPEAPAGITVSDGRLNLPAVSGSPGAVYFTISNESNSPKVLRAVSVQGAGMAMLHETVTSGEQSSMQEVTQMTVPAHGELVLEPGGFHVMAMDLPEGLETGGEIEATVTLSGGDKISFPLAIRAPGEE